MGILYLLYSISGKKSTAFSAHSKKTLYFIQKSCCEGGFQRFSKKDRPVNDALARVFEVIHGMTICSVPR